MESRKASRREFWAIRSSSQRVNFWFLSFLGEAGGLLVLGFEEVALDACAVVGALLTEVLKTAELVLELLEGL